MQSNTRWNNNLAFLLAATGSAVGLGNIWGFPYKAGEDRKSTRLNSSHW